MKTPMITSHGASVEPIWATGTTRLAQRHGRVVLAVLERRGRLRGR